METSYSERLSSMYDMTSAQIEQTREQYSSPFRTFSQMLDSERAENSTLRELLHDNHLRQHILASTCKLNRIEYLNNLHDISHECDREVREMKRSVRTEREKIKLESVAAKQDFKSQIYQMNKENNNLFVNLLQTRDHASHVSEENSLLRDRIFDMSNSITDLMRKITALQQLKHKSEEATHCLLRLNDELNTLISFVMDCSHANTVKIGQQKEMILSLERSLDQRIHEIHQVESKLIQRDELIRSQQVEIDKLKVLLEHMTVMYETSVNNRGPAK